MMYLGILPTHLDISRDVPRSDNVIFRTHDSGAIQGSKQASSPLADDLFPSLSCSNHIVIQAGCKRKSRRFRHNAWRGFDA
jgi:hypothetical protein